MHKTPTDSEVSLVFSWLVGTTEERGESFGLDSYVGKLLIGFSNSILIRYYIYFFINFIGCINPIKLIKQRAF